MRLPNFDELRGDDERLLWEHDEVELHDAVATSRALTYRRRLEVMVDLLQTHAPEGLILDAACAQGNVAITLAEKGRRTVGLDLRPPFLQYAKRKDESFAVEGWVSASVEHLPFRRASFSAIVLGEVVEHVAHPEHLFRQAAEGLCTGGIVVASTPNGDRLATRLPNLVDIADRSELEERQFQPDADGHLFLLTKNELILAGTAAGLRFVEHRFIQSPLITGWPKIGALVERLPERLRHVSNRKVEQMRFSSRIAAGQVAVFRKQTGPPGRAFAGAGAVANHVSARSLYTRTG